MEGWDCWLRGLPSFWGTSGQEILVIWPLATPRVMSKRLEGMLQSATGKQDYFRLSADGQNIPLLYLKWNSINQRFDARSFCQPCYQFNWFSLNYIWTGKEGIAISVRRSLKLPFHPLLLPRTNVPLAFYFMHFDMKPVSTIYRIFSFISEIFFFFYFSKNYFLKYRILMNSMFYVMQHL